MAIEHKKYLHRGMANSLVSIYKVSLRPKDTASGQPSVDFTFFESTRRTASAEAEAAFTGTNLTKIFPFHRFCSASETTPAKWRRRVAPEGGAATRGDGGQGLGVRQLDAALKLCSVLEATRREYRTHRDPLHDVSRELQRNASVSRVEALHLHLTEPDRISTRAKSRHKRPNLLYPVGF